MKRLKEQKIIMEIHTPTDWCSPIVVVPKVNGTFRICVYLTKLNESVRREKFPLPTTDQLSAHLAEATDYNKLDCNKGFHQIPLSKESQELTTFITLLGFHTNGCQLEFPLGQRYSILNFTSLIRYSWYNLQY